MSSRILFISNFRAKPDGWGEAARGLALAMHTVGLDVVCRSINMGKPDSELCPTMEGLLAKSSQGCDICIQHVLPSMMEYSSGFKRNIGSFVSETLGYQYGHNTTRLNYMDELWVPCKGNSRAVPSEVSTPVVIIPHAFDPEKYNRQYTKFDIPEARGDYIFYFIGEAIKRKNLMATIKAFHTEFSPNEPVQLVIKGSRSGLNPQECSKFIAELCNTAKTNLKLYKDTSKYKSEIIITSQMSDDDICGLHQYGDCFVSSSYGEGWNIPAYESLAFGNKLISSDEGGPQSYVVQKDNGILVRGEYVPCFGMTDSLPELYTSREICFDINIEYLMRGMRWAFENRDKKPETDVVTPFSYEYVGTMIKEVLELTQ